MAEYLLYQENNDGVVDALQHRAMTTAALWNRSGTFTTEDAFASAGGVKDNPGTTPANVTQNSLGADLSVDVSEGQVLVQAVHSGASAGTYVWTNTDTVNVPLTTPPDATNPRIDLVVIQATDTTFGDASSGLSPLVITGIPAATPSAPSIPLNSTPLATIDVAANATTIVNANLGRFQWAYGHSGVAGSWVTIGAKNNGSHINEIFPDFPVPGQIVLDETTGVAQYWSPVYSSWRPLFNTSKLTAFTPVLTASTTNPTLGTGSSRVGYYRYIGPKLVWFTVDITFGTSGVNAGSGIYSVSLPLPASASTILHSGNIYGSINDDSTGDNNVVSSGISSDLTHMTMYFWDPTSISVQTVHNNAPFTWAANDAIQFSGIYEVA